MRTGTSCISTHWGSTSTGCSCISTYRGSSFISFFMFLLSDWDVWGLFLSLPSRSKLGTVRFMSCTTGTNLLFLKNNLNIVSSWVFSSKNWNFLTNFFRFFNPFTSFFHSPLSDHHISPPPPQRAFSNKKMPTWRPFHLPIRNVGSTRNPQDSLFAPWQLRTSICETSASEDFPYLKWNFIHRNVYLRFFPSAH